MWTLAAQDRTVGRWRPCGGLSPHQGPVREAGRPLKTEAQLHDLTPMPRLSQVIGEETVAPCALRKAQVDVAVSSVELSGVHIQNVSGTGAFSSRNSLTNASEGGSRGL